MKTKPKLILCAFIFLVGGVANVFISAALHNSLSGYMQALSFVSFPESINSMAVDRQHFLLFLCAQGFVLTLSVAYFLTNMRPYQSRLNTVTPDIQTPAAVGQYQHGSAKWLTDQEKDTAFENFVFDPKVESAVNVPKTGVVLGMKKLENGKEQIFYEGDDVHTLCIDATRSGKSRTIVVQSICRCPKGEILQIR